jgi:hypothetical protein
MEGPGRETGDELCVGDAGEGGENDEALIGEMGNACG